MQNILAFLLIVLLSPVLLLTAFFVALFDGLPIIFTQDRIGKGKKVFTIYKFKTMKNDQITGLGRILRKTGLDELPQLFNILSGNMRFVGPRPLTQADIDRLEWNDVQFDARWQVHPGLTGLAQLVPVCDKNVSISNDLHYVQHKSALLDLRICLNSVLIPFIGKQRMKKILHKTEA